MTYAITVPRGNLLSPRRLLPITLLITLGLVMGLSVGLLIGRGEAHTAVPPAGLTRDTGVAGSQLVVVTTPSGGTPSCSNMTTKDADTGELAVYLQVDSIWQKIACQKVA